MSGPIANVPAAVIGDPGVTLSAKVVLMCISTYSNSDGWCWPSIGTISGICTLSRTAVKEAIRALIERGYLERTERHIEGSGRQTSNLYRVVYDYDRLEQAARKPVEVLPLEDDDEPEAPGAQPPPLKVSNLTNLLKK